MKFTIIVFMVILFKSKNLSQRWGKKYTLWTLCMNFKTDMICWIVRMEKAQDYIILPLRLKEKSWKAGGSHKYTFLYIQFKFHLIKMNWNFSFPWMHTAEVMLPGHLGKLLNLRSNHNKDKYGRLRLFRLFCLRLKIKFIAPPRSHNNKFGQNPKRKIHNRAQITKENGISLFLIL